MNTSKIKSIKVIENPSLLYDIEVKKTNCFFANNILVHNSSFTCYLKNDVFGVCGRTVDFKVPDDEMPYDEMNTYWKVAIKLDLENKLRTLKRIYELGDIAFQGEMIGEGIQGNIYKIKGQTVLFYNAFDIDSQEYWEYEAFLNALRRLELESVPILDDNFELPENPNDLLLEADEATTVFGNNLKQLAEGRVYIAKGKLDPKLRILRSNFQRLSFKAKSREYQIKHK